VDRLVCVGGWINYEVGTSQTNIRYFISEFAKYYDLPTSGIIIILLSDATKEKIS
jgi:hypothetical protein